MKALLKGLSAMLLLALTGCGAASTAPAPGSAPPSSAVASTPAKPAGSAAVPASGGPKDKLRAGFLSYSTTSSIEFVSKAAGLYDKYGLDVDLTFVRPAVLTTALNAGKDFDFGYASAANIPTVNVKGGDLVMIAGSAQGGIFSLVAGPGIKSVADLKGKKAAVTSTGSTTDLLLRQVLQQNNLTPEKDVSIVVIADDSAIVAALTAHQVDAIMNSEPFTSIAVAQGGTVIYDQSKSGERAVQTPVTVKRSYLPAHRDVMKRVLMANMEAIHMIKTDPNQAAQYAAPFLKLDDVGVLATALKRTAQIMEPDMNIPMENLATSLKIAAANVPEVASLKPEDLVDLSILQEIKASGFVEKLYQ